MPTSLAATSFAEIYSYSYANIPDTRQSLGFLRRKIFDDGFLSKTFWCGGSLLLPEMTQSTSSGISCPYIAAAAPAWVRLCCHRRSRGNCLGEMRWRDVEAHRVAPVHIYDSN